MGFVRPVVDHALTAYGRLRASLVTFPTSMLRELDDALVPLDDDVPGPGTQPTFG